MCIFNTECILMFVVFFVCVLIIHSISEGCTLKLVLAMRGGPINTSRGRHMLKLRILKQFDSSNLQAR